MKKVKKIESNNVADILYLTPMQEGMLFHYLSQSDADQYFSQMCYTIEGTLDSRLLEEAWQTVIDNNEMLRTLFRWQELEKPLQIILKKYLTPFYEYVISCKEDEIEEIVDEMLKNDRKEKIDITSEPFRIKLYKLCDEKWFMIVSSYNIIFDGWSNGVILKELVQAYENSSQQKSGNTHVKTKFKEFILWHQKRDIQGDREYWKRQLLDFDTTNTLNLAIDESLETGDYRNISYYFSKEDENIITLFTQDRRTTLATLIYTSWAIFLYKYSGYEDIIFGVTVSGRPTEISGIDDVVGMFINTIPLRVNLRCENSIYDLINQINDSLIDSKDYQYTPITELMSAAGIKDIRDFFQSVIVVQNYPLDRLLFDTNKNLNIKLYSKFNMTDFPITLGITIFDGINLDLRYHSKYFPQFLVESIINTFGNIMRGIANSKECTKIGDIEVVDIGKKNQIISNIEFNKKQLESLKEVDLDEIF